MNTANHSVASCEARESRHFNSPPLRLSRRPRQTSILVTNVRSLFATATSGPRRRKHPDQGPIERLSMNRGVMGMVALDHITLAPLGATPRIPVPCRPALRRPPLPPRPEPVGGQVDDKFPTTGRPRVEWAPARGSRTSDSRTDQKAEGPVASRRPVNSALHRATIPVGTNRVRRRDGVNRNDDPVSGTLVGQLKRGLSGQLCATYSDVRREVGVT